MVAIPCRLDTVVIDELQDSHSLRIAEIDGERAFTIHIGAVEALAIQRQLHGQQFPRPLTHDLLVAVLEQMDASCTAVHISRFSNDTFYAEMEIARGNSTTSIDCRPSDALAILVRLHDVPLLVADDVLDAVG